MASDHSSRKTFIVVGSESDIVIGHLIYKLGGIDLPRLAKLQEKDIDSYYKAVRELRDTKEELYFYTPLHRVTIKDPNFGADTDADGLILVVSPTAQSHEPLLPETTITQLKHASPLFSQKKAIILVETTKSSEALDHNALDPVVAELRQIGISTDNATIIPSDLRGKNFIETSTAYGGPTLVAAIDGMDL